MKSNLALTFFIILLISANGIFAEESSKVAPTPTVDVWMEFKGPVSKDPRILGKSFTFKGRVSYMNGNQTSLKVWMVGTHRILGVLTDNCVPDNLAAVLKKDLGAQVYGVFTVFPFTPIKKGEMQYVCIDSVKITQVVKGK